MKEDIITREVDAPQGRWCSSGHFAPEKFQDKPTRFFAVSSSIAPIDGVYCEPCLIVANHVARKKRMYGV